MIKVGTMKIKTSRFGSFEFLEKDQLLFPEGLLGFDELRKFIFLNDSLDEIFIWLQSCEQPEVAFPILEPSLFASHYEIELTKNDLEVLRLKKAQAYIGFSIITIPDDPLQMTANLKAPIIVNKEQKVAKQCVLQDHHLSIREPIFSNLRQRMIQGSSLSFKNRILNEWKTIISVKSSFSSNPSNPSSQSRSSSSPPSFSKSSHSFEETSSEALPKVQKVSELAEP